MLRRVVEMREDGYGVRRTATNLNEDGTPARGKRWHANTISRMLKAHDEQATAG